jgi:hypothetical protein
VDGCEDTNIDIELRWCRERSAKVCFKFSVNEGGPSADRDPQFWRQGRDWPKKENHQGLYDIVSVHIHFTET